MPTAYEYETVGNQVLDVIAAQLLALSQIWYSFCSAGGKIKTCTCICINNLNIYCLPSVFQYVISVLKSLQPLLTWHFGWIILCTITWLKIHTCNKQATDWLTFPVPWIHHTRISVSSQEDTLQHVHISWASVSLHHLSADATEMAAAPKD